MGHGHVARDACSRTRSGTSSPRCRRSRHAVGPAADTHALSRRLQRMRADATRPWTQGRSVSSPAAQPARLRGRQRGGSRPQRCRRALARRLSGATTPREVPRTQGRSSRLLAAGGTRQSRSSPGEVRAERRPRTRRHRLCPAGGAGCRRLGGRNDGDANHRRQPRPSSACTLGPRHRRSLRRACRFRRGRASAHDGTTIRHSGPSDCNLNRSVSI